MGHTDRPAPAAWVGLGVSQHTLDAYLLPGPQGKPRSRAFANDAAGHAALAAWADAHAGGAALGFCLESTGAYGEALAGAGRHAAVVNPARVKYAGLMRGCGNKTDKADARLIAEYACRERPAPRQPPRPEVRQLQALSRRRDDLRRLAAREKARLAAPGLTPADRESITRTAAFLEKEADRFQGEADGLIAADAVLRADRALLLTIPGVGPAAACAVLAELPDPGPVRVGAAGGRLRRAGAARAPLGHQRQEAHPPVQGRQRPAAPGAVPAGPDGGPVQPPPQGVSMSASSGRARRGWRQSGPACASS